MQFVDKYRKLQAFNELYDLGNNYVTVANTLEINGTSTDMNNLVTTLLQRNNVIFT